MPRTQDKLSALKMEYKALHGSIHPALEEFSADIQVMIVELALEGGLDIKAHGKEHKPLNPDGLIEQITRFFQAH